MAPEMWAVLMVAWAALLCLMTCYLLMRIPLEKGRRRVELLRRGLRMEDPV